MTDNINEINANLKRAETSIKAAKDMIEKEEIRDYIVKPFNAQELITKIKMALGE